MNKVIYIILLGVISCPAFGIGNKRDSLRQKKSGFIETLGLIIFVLWLLRLLGIVDF